MGEGTSGEEVEIGSAAILCGMAEHNRLSRAATEIQKPPDIIFVGAIDYLYRRDGGICHLCGLRVLSRGNYLLNPMHPLAPTRDHIQPVSKHGCSASDNLALAHRICNGIRGNLAVSDELKALCRKTVLLYIVDDA